ncbi:HutD family protein [Pararobbsia silviterrae]|nr:HutD family protein [Pararobbsia silviterrae]
MHNASPIVTFEKISAASRQPVLWKNRGGVTREIARQASTRDDTFDWRVSVADVDQPGPFSTFEHVDRILVVIRGDQMVIRRDDTALRLACWEPYAFPGEAPITAHLPSGPTRDFNLMVRRAHGRGSVHVHRDAESLAMTDGTAVLYCATGAFSIRALDDDGAPVELEEGDALRIDLDADMAFDVQPTRADSVLIDARIVPFVRATRPSA